MSVLPPVSLVLPTDSRMLTVARAFVEAVCQTWNLDRRLTHAVVLASSEAISNVIRHAHQNRPEAQMQVQCFLCQETIEIHILDEGEPFDLSAVPHLNPSEERPGGRGVFLMRSLMDELICEPRPPRGNFLRLIKRRTPVAAVRECG